MQKWIALFRGMNVGGHNVISMKDLSLILEDIGLKEVKTYIQSGNAVFQCKEENSEVIQKNIEKKLFKSRKMDSRVLLISLKNFRKITAANPFPQGEREPAKLHVFFLTETPLQPNLEGMKTIQAPSEKFHLAKTAFYLYAPMGIGKSKLATRVEKLLGVPTTARNWNTIQKMIELASPTS